MNYENVVERLRGTPPHQLALPATGERQTRTSRQKKTAAVAQPVTPGPVTTQSAKQSPCARHTAGLCPGSDVAREAYSEFLKNNPKGGESFKGSGKQSGKGKKGNTKSGSTAPAAVATAASSMTITGVEGKQVQKSWHFLPVLLQGPPFVEHVLEVVGSYSCHIDVINYKFL
jgi:hypothetical protein